MKPISVRFQCFGPYMQEQYIDFTRFSDSGVFLICGETGAGKTTILDAICYALYGRSSGGLRGDISVMRCKLAGQKDETLVEYIFDCNGERYKFTRSLKYGRKKLNDSHNCMILKDGAYVPIFENPKATFVNQKAQELIGLTYDQFRQVIILPQGQFEKLLVSDSAEKEKILVSLFHAQRWQQIAEEISRRVNARDDALKREYLQITAKLRDLSCESLDALREKISQEEKSLAAWRQDEERLLEDHTRQKKLYEGALVENQAFDRLRQLETRLSGLEGRKKGFSIEESLLHRGDLAQQLRPQYSTYVAAKELTDKKQRQLQKAQSAKETAASALTAAQKRRQSHEQGREAHIARQQRLVLLSSAVELYRSLAQKQTAVTQALSAVKRREMQRDQAQKAFLQADDLWKKAMEAQTQTQNIWQSAQNAYLRSIGSILAARLEEGKPCPVCGSTSHPMPALCGKTTITEAKLEELNQALLQASEAVSNAMEQRTARERAKDAAVTSCNETQQRLAAAQSDYEAALARKFPDIDSERDLEKAMAVLRRQIQDFEADDRKTLADLNGAVSNEQVALSAWNGAQEDLREAKQKLSEEAALWKAALGASSLADEETFLAAYIPPKELETRKAALIAFRTQLEDIAQQTQDQRQLLAGKEAPDMAALEKARQEAEKAYNALRDQILLADRDLAGLRGAEKDLSVRLEAYRKERLSVDSDLEFANRLRGTHGISLQRYVLGVMLTSITVEANRLLKSVYGGRYQLYRTNEVAGQSRKSGLELEVYDAANSERRSVTTLSGGEKFLVALSLAIGLSAVVQAQGGGVRLEAMFIDEGFGSLDKEAVNDALDVLTGIQRSTSVVGIISHVEQLAETIPAKITVRKGKDGSTCHIQA